MKENILIRIFLVLLLVITLVTMFMVIDMKTEFASFDELAGRAITIDSEQCADYDNIENAIAVVCLGTRPLGQGD